MKLFLNHLGMSWVSGAEMLSQGGEQLGWGVLTSMPCGFFPFNCDRRTLGEKHSEHRGKPEIIFTQGRD